MTVSIVSHSSSSFGNELMVKDYPDYFKALEEKQIIASDADQTDPST
jgi:hypothetical protein